VDFRDTKQYICPLEKNVPHILLKDHRALSRVGNYKDVVLHTVPSFVRVKSHNKMKSKTSQNTAP
jgi:hypothetical protein